MTDSIKQLWLRACARLKAGDKKERRGVWLLLAGLSGILLIGLSSVLSAATEETVTTAQTDSAEVYAAQMEERLCRLISSIAGAGETQVLVTLENGVEYVYASEERLNSDSSDNGDSSSRRDDSEQSVVIVDGTNGREGLLVTEIQPTVRGVVVACEGGGEETVAAAVKKAVTTALNITEKRVCVMPLQSKGD